MKKNGFTLVELIAVIAILALLITIAVPVITNSRDDTLKALSKEQERGLKDAGKLVGVDLDDYSTDIYNCKTDSWIEDKCIKDEDTKKWVQVKLDIADLKAHGYFTDSNSHCSGSLTITKTTSGDYNVEMDSSTSC